MQEFLDRMAEELYLGEDVDKNVDAQNQVNLMEADLESNCDNKEEEI